MSGNGSRNGIKAESTPGMAAAQAVDGESGAAKRPVGPDGIDGIHRTGRNKTAGRRRTEQQATRRNDQPVIAAQQEQKKVLGGAQAVGVSVATSRNRPTRFRASR